MRYFKAILLSILLVFGASVHAESSHFIKFLADKYEKGELNLPKSKLQEIDCMGKNLWFEARGDTFEGKKMVAEVVINRSNFGRPFKSGICEVVYQKGQFQWVERGSLKDVKFDYILHKYLNTVEKQYMRDALELSIQYVLLTPKSKTEATNFCSARYDCKFKGVEFIGRFGAHNFYKYVG